MLNCKNVSEDATDHLEGEATFMDGVSLRFHLLICKHCRRFYRQFRIAVGTSAKLRTIDAPTDTEIDDLVRKLKERY